jgi:hypothetical protein
VAKFTELGRKERTRKQTQKYAAMVVLGGAALGIFLWFAFVAKDQVTNGRFAAGGAISIIVFAVCVMMAKRFYSDQADAGSSLKGEDAVCAALEKELGDGFGVLKNVPVPVKGGKKYVDLLVVGPTGIFPLVTKSDGTKIEAVGFKRMWKVTYTGVTDNDVSKRIFNPLMQADELAAAVSGYMKEKKAPFSAAVYPMVIFTAKGTEIEFDSIESKTPVCVLDGEIIKLRNHILNRKQQMDEDAVRRTLELFGAD